MRAIELPGLIRVGDIVFWSLAVFSERKANCISKLLCADVDEVWPQLIDYPVLE